MTANAPKPGGDEIFIVLLEVLRLSPGKLLVVCKGFKYNASKIKTKGRKITHAKSGAQTRLGGIDQPDRQADKSDPSRCENITSTMEMEVIISYLGQTR